MTFLILRDDKQYGPYPIGSLADMIRKNEVVPSDMIWSEGRTNWQTVESFLRSTATSSPAAAVPPPLPPQLPPPLPSRTPPVMPSNRTSTVPPVCPGNVEAENELEKQVLEGGRFVVFQYCFSVLIMSFKRSSSVIFLRRDEDGLGNAFGHSIISLLAGWWGIPWGPIWTIGTVFKNAWGGLDVTSAVLAQKLGPARANQIMAQRPKPLPPGLGMNLFRIGLIAVPALIVLCVFLLPVMSVMESSPSRRLSNRAYESGGFSDANRLINTDQGQTAMGNSTQAVAIAKSFSTQISVMRDLFFQGGKKDGISVSGHKFLTYCHLAGTNCAIIVHVPELRRFSSDAKNSMGNMAWICAGIALMQEGLTNSPMNVAIGLRGVLLYDRVLIGTTSNDTPGKSKEPTETIIGGTPENRLYPYFQKQRMVVPQVNVEKVLSEKNASNPQNPFQK